MPLAVGVVHLGHHAGQGTVRVVAPEDRQRIEHVAEHPGVGQHHDVAAAQVDAPFVQVAVEVSPQRLRRVADVVAGLEAGQHPQGPARPGQVVQVDQPQVAAVAEHVAQRGQPGVADPTLVQRGAGGQRAAGHQVPPRAAAA